MSRLGSWAVPFPGSLPQIHDPRFSDLLDAVHIEEGSQFFAEDIGITQQLNHINQRASCFRNFEPYNNVAVARWRVALLHIL